MNYFEPPAIKYIHGNIIKTIRKHKIKAYRYLDIGCGSGIFTIKVAEIVGAIEVYAVDIRESISGVGAKKNIKFSKVDLNHDKLPYSNNYFDLVTIIEVIEHLTNINNCIKEAIRVVRKNGYIILSTPNLVNWRNRILVLLGKYPQFLSLPHEYGHLHLYTVKTLLAYLKSLGLEVIDITGAPTKFVSVSNILPYKILGFIDAFLSRKVSFATDIIVLARKS